MDSFSLFLASFSLIFSGATISLYFRAFDPIISFSKSLRRDLNTFLDGCPDVSDISARVNSLPSFNAATTLSSVLLSFIYLHQTMTIYVIRIGILILTTKKMKKSFSQN